MPAALSLPRISTNVRFAASALLAPDLAGAWAERLFLTPPRPKDAVLASLDLIDAKSGLLEHKGRAIATWTWGARSREAPAVLLAHGWGGNAAQMRGFVFPLLSAGYRVVAFDQPAHGVSEGKLSGLPDFAEVLAEVAWQAGEGQGGVEGVVAHSLGGAATALAIARGLKVQRVVLIGTSLDVGAHARRFARWHGMPERVRVAMQGAIEERFGVRWSQLDVATLAPRLAAPALVIHDCEDRAVPWTEAARFAGLWPQARLLLTRGLGHRRILEDESVTRAAADFIAGRSAVAEVAAPVLPNPAPLY
ncbi:MAG TPA: alpha/beta fold hydrolase [Burkholderiales bacterium]